MSYLEMYPPKSISGVPILPLWGTLTAAVHDGNFYYKDKYTFPPITRPTQITGACSTDITLIDVYLGEWYGSPVDRTNRIATVTPVSGTYEFYLPRCSPGMIKLTAVGYNSLHEIVATVRLDFLTANWAILLWGFYAVVLSSIGEIDVLLHPWLSQNKVRLQEILRDYLPLTRTPQVDWETIESARAITRGALQALYANHTTRKAILDYLKAWFGSLPLLENPDGWYLGGTDYREAINLSATIGVSGAAANTPVSYTVISDTFRNVISNASISVVGKTITVTSTGETYPGAAPIFEIDLLSTQFTDGDSIVVANYVQDSLAWPETPTTETVNDTEIIASSTSNTSQYWQYTANLATTVANFVSAWNRTISPVHNLTAAYVGNYGRVLIIGTSKNPDTYSRKCVYKSGPYPDLCPIRILPTRMWSVSPGDTITVTTVATGAVSDYGSLFLAQDKSDQVQSSYGTVTLYNDSLPFGQQETYIRVNEYWELDSYTYSIVMHGTEAEQDLAGDITKVAGAWYFRLPVPCQSILSVSVSGTPISTTFIDPDVVVIGSNQPGSSTEYTITAKRRPDMEAQEATDRARSVQYPAVAHIEKRPQYSVLYASDLQVMSATDLSYTATMMKNVDGVWARDKCSHLLVDSDCGATSWYVESGVFSVGDIISCGRDTVTITQVTAVPYIGDIVTFEPGTLEKHYRGEYVYIPDTIATPTLELSTPLDMMYPASIGLPVPINAGVYLDLFDSQFGPTERKVYISQSDSLNSGWTSWTESPYPYLLRPASIDPMCDPSKTSTYIPWGLSYGASGTYTISYLNDQPAGELNVGCMRISGGSASTTIGVEKRFPRSFNPGTSITFYAKGSGTSGTCYIDLSSIVPLNTTASDLGYKFAFAKPGASWTKITVDISSIPESVRKNIRIVRFRSTVSGTLDVFGLFPGTVYRYAKIKIVATGTRRREDYVLSRIGVHTFHTRHFRNVLNPGSGS